MTAQLQLDVAARRAAPIDARLLRELDHLHQHPPAPDDAENVRAHRALIAGHEHGRWGDAVARGGEHRG